MQIREYGDGFPVRIEGLAPMDAESCCTCDAETGRLVVVALAEDGHVATMVDLKDLLRAAKEQHPDLWRTVSEER